MCCGDPKNKTQNSNRSLQFYIKQETQGVFWFQFFVENFFLFFKACFFGQQSFHEFIISRKVCAIIFEIEIKIVEIVLMVNIPLVVLPELDFELVSSRHFQKF